MIYEVTMTEEKVNEFEHPHKALEALRDELKEKMIAENQNLLYFDYTATNEGKTLKITAVFSEARKKHVDESQIEG